jgi:AcrR family transcriptional regulator
MAAPATGGFSVDAPAAGDAGSPDPVPRRLRADAARNRQRLIDAAAEVFAARGLNATLDDIARQAGVNVATAYRHFANKHELAREFIQQWIDRVAAIAEESAANPDPWAGLTGFLTRALELMTANRALDDVLTGAHDSAQFADLLRRTTEPLDRLLARGRAAGVVRDDIAGTDFPAILEMLSTLTGLGLPDVPHLPHRYIGLILAGLRPGGEPLPDEPPTIERLEQAAAAAVSAKRHLRAIVGPASMAAPGPLAGPGASAGPGPDQPPARG